MSTFRELGAEGVVGGEDAAADKESPADEREDDTIPIPEAAEPVDPAEPEIDPEIGAETWLETARKSSHEAKKKALSPIEQNTESPTSKSDPNPEKAEKLITNPIAKAAAEADEKARMEDQVEAKIKERKAEIDVSPKKKDDVKDDLGETDEAREEDEPEEIEESGSEEKAADLGADAQPKEVLSAGSMEALLGGLSTDEDVELDAEAVVAAETKEEENHTDSSVAEIGKKLAFWNRRKEDQTGPLDPAKMPADFSPPEKKEHGPDMRSVRCFKCNHVQNVSLCATSTQCGRCSVYISLSDYDIRTAQSQTIRTRGNVTIHKRGSLIGCDIACHDLTVLGKISGSVDCSGNAVFKNSGKVVGSMHCKHLQVDKKCELVFPQGVVAESADIYGIVHGNITCSGTVRIFKSGAVNGDATAKAIVLKDGGILSGQMSIQHDVDIELPVKKGYDPSIIR
ncbi:MAG: polymer-forming cytoskeletal protein [Verrucomicrobiales bacterium]|nr:polymer-forming cytoskeletal protein [Verrucomicrobiales bacterium]